MTEISTIKNYHSWRLCEILEMLQIKFAHFSLPQLRKIDRWSKLEKFIYLPVADQSRSNIAALNLASFVVVNYTHPQPFWQNFAGIQVLHRSLCSYPFFKCVLTFQFISQKNFICALINYSCLFQFFNLFKLIPLLLPLFHLIPMLKKHLSNYESVHYSQKSFNRFYFI